jgi:hypothetical protein
MEYVVFIAVQNLHSILFLEKLNLQCVHNNVTPLCLYTFIKNLWILPVLEVELFKFIILHSFIFCTDTLIT